MNSACVAGGEAGHLFLWLAKILPKVDAKIGQIELIARDDERDLLLYQPLPLIRCERARGKHNGSIRDLRELVHLSAQSMQRRQPSLARAGQQNVPVSQRELINIERILQEVWEALHAAPRMDARVRAECLVQIRLDSGRQRLSFRRMLI
jgi:hypothetical protein